MLSSRSQGAPDAATPASLPRRRWFRTLSGAGLLGAAWAAASNARVFAQQVQAFVMGPPVPDMPPVQVSPHVWMVYAPEGFPTEENHGMMASVVFVVTAKGVVVLDSGASVQIGRMAIRMIRTVTDQPVVAVFNSHYHGDHWLGNHAFVEAYGDALPIHALAHTREQIAGYEGDSWRSAMERWTQGATLGTKVVVPNQTVEHGQVFDYGDVQIRLHHYGRAHTPSDLCLEVVQDRLTYVGDIAMGDRIANMDDGSYPGTFTYYADLKAAAGEQLWLPGHGEASRTLLDDYETFFRGIWEPCVQAVEDGVPLEDAKALVLQDPRVVARQSMAGFDNNIGKYTSLAYLEAEQELF